MHLDLSVVADSQLTFNYAIRDFAEEFHNIDGIYFSDDGGATFTEEPVITFQSEQWINEYGARIPYDLDKLIEDAGLTLSNQFVIRFQQYDNADFNTSGDEDGITLDNISIRFDKSVKFQTLPFCDNFFDSCISSSNCPLSSAWKVSSREAVEGVNPTSLNSESLTRFPSVGIINGASSDADSYSLYMGKWRDDEGLNTNAVDLHLNLTGHQNDEVILSFWLYDFADDNHIEDAIYFSSDGGVSWEKTYSIKPESLENSFNYTELNISELIQSSAQLSFSSKFVIRFQQYDNADFNTSGDEDGFIIDDVNVYANKQSCQVVGIEIPQHEKITIQVSPNPVHTFLNITLPKPRPEKVQIQITNITGKIILQRNIQQQLSIDMSTFAKGIYFVNVKSKQGTHTQKILKQ